MTDLHNPGLDLTLRLLTEDDLPALEGVYAAASEALRQLYGGPPAAGQAAADFVAALAEAGRYQFGVFFDGALAGMIDCKLDDQEEGVVHIGLLLMAPPYDEPEVAALALRVVERWLAATFAVQLLQVGAPAHSPGDVAFWQAQGYTLSGAQYRREMGNFTPRFLVLTKNA